MVPNLALAVCWPWPSLNFEASMVHDVMPLTSVDSAHPSAQTRPGQV